MKKVPHDIDKLMWLIADQGDLRAVDDFEQRFPELKYELGRRMTMVRNLRGAKETTPAAKKARAIPQFTPRATIQPLFPRPLAIAAITAALALFAFGSYFVTRNFVENRPESHVPPVANSGGNGGSSSTPGGNQPVTAPDGSLSRNRPNRPAIEPPPKTGPKLVTIKLEGVGLQQALDFVSVEAGLRFEIGPGLENPTVDLNYRNVPITELLEDLGKKYHFSALDQGQGTYLIIPARDGASAPPSSGSSNSGATGGSTGAPGSGIPDWPLYGGNE